MKRGVPAGYRHLWGYRGVWRERKNPDGTWDVDYRATKKKKAKRYGGFKKGFKIKWGLKGTQTAVKTDKGQYQTHLKAKKWRIKGGKK